MANDLGKQLSSFIQKLNRALNKVSSLEFLDSVGKATVPMIQGRVRRGFSVEKSGEEEKSFAPLSKKYIQMRMSKKQSGPKAKQIKLTTAEKLSSFTTPTKSNLTFTARMIESIRYRLFKDKVEIGLSGKRNKELAGYHESGTNKMPARPFLHLSANEKKKIRQLFERQLGGAIRSLITK